jgi:hypothetical protein
MRVLSHSNFAEEKSVVFYDLHEYEIKGNNNDDIHAPTIMPKMTTK